MAMTGCEPDPDPLIVPEPDPIVEEEDLIALIPELDISLIPVAERALSRALTIETPDQGKEIIDSFGIGIYADAMNEVIKWVKTNAHNYSTDTVYKFTEPLVIPIPGTDAIMDLYSLIYSASSQEIKVYLFFLAGGETNPFRMYIWNRKNAGGGYTADFAWASYNDMGTPGSADNDYQSSYMFRINTGDNSTFWYSGGKEYDETTNEFITMSPSGYSEMTLTNAASKFGTISSVNEVASKASILHSDVSGFYIWNESEEDYGDELGTLVGKAYLNRSFVYDPDFTAWPVAFEDKISSWGGTADQAKTADYDPPDYIPAFDHLMFKSIWPEAWLSVLQSAAD